MAADSIWRTCPVRSTLTERSNGERAFDQLPSWRWSIPAAM